MIPRKAVFWGALLAFFLALNGPAAGQSTDVIYAVYVANCGSRCLSGGVGPGDISAYIVNETTGALTEVFGSPIAAGFNPAAIAAHPDGTNVYVVNEFSEDTGNAPGTLTRCVTEDSGFLTPCSSVPVGSRPVSVAVDPWGRYIYVANSGSHNISAFYLDTTGYPWLPIPGSPFPAGTTPTSVAVHPNGQFLYVANSGDGTVSGYSIDVNTGELTALSGSPFDVGAESFAVSPSGLHGYAVHTGSNLISGWPINPTTGALGPSASGYGRTGSAPLSVTVMLDPVTGQQLIYVTNFLSDDISAFRGALTPVVGSPFRVYPAFLPVSATVDPTGQFLYVASRSRAVSAFTINGTTGELTQIVGSPFQAGAHPRAVVAVAVPVPGFIGP